MQNNILKDKYLFEDLLENPFFIESVKHPTDENRAFWDAQLAEGRLTKADRDLASSLILLARGKQEIPTSKDVNNMWHTISDRNKQAKQKRFFGLFASFAFVAASIVGIWLFNKQSVPAVEPKPMKVEEMYINLLNDTLPTSTEIQINTSNNGLIVVNNNHPKIKYASNGSLKIDQKSVTNDAQKSNESQAKEVALHQIVVPHGKHSTLYLSDGSVLCINANTRVIYPAVFAEKDRTIYVEGEVFIDVFPNANQPFIVKTNQFEVNVLGTSFNLKAYKNAPQSVVLVKGSVKVSSSLTGDIQIRPNQLLEIMGDKSTLQTVDVAPYIAWKDGLQMYQNSYLGNILDGLSAYYGVKIYYKDNIAQLKFSGKLELKEQLAPVLKGILLTTSLQCKFVDGAYYIE